MFRNKTTRILAKSEGLEGYSWAIIDVVCVLSHFRVFCDPMDSSLPGSSVMGFPRQECWSGLPFPTPGDFSDPGIEPALTGGCFTTSATWEAPIDVEMCNQKCLCYSERCELPLSSSFFPCCWFLKVSEQTTNLVMYLILSL